MLHEFLLIARWCQLFHGHSTILDSNRYNDGDTAKSVSGSSIVSIDLELFSTLGSTSRTAKEPATGRKRTFVATDDEGRVKTPRQKRGRLLEGERTFKLYVARNTRYMHVHVHVHVLVVYTLCNLIFKCN